MTRYLLPLAVLSAICLTSQNAWAEHHDRSHSGNVGRRAAAGFANAGYAPSGHGYRGAGYPVTAFGYAAGGYGAYGFGPYPGYVAMRYPGVGYVTPVVPGLPGNIYTQSYFNSPAYGHWNGFGN
jgi:hypothetical protein